MKKSMQLKFARRRQQRGAVFVEAIVVCLLLMVFMASGLFFHRLYAAKFRAMRASRAQAWSAATSGCASQLGLGQIFNLVSIDSCTGEDCRVGGLGSTTDTVPEWTSIGAQVASAAETVSAHEKAGGGSYSTTASTRVICNELEQDARGDVWSIVEYMADSVAGP